MPKTFKWILVAALSGFLFGFDTVVISGANLPIKELWSTSPIFHGFFIMSMALWGTVIGALFGSLPSNRLGRKITLSWIGFFFFISALGSALAIDPYTFSFFRFIGGIGVGVSTVAAPTYVSEIAPSNQRGKMVALYQFNIVLGILMAFVSNYFFRNFGNEPWRWMLGIEALPSILYLIGVWTIPQSPRWLIIKKNKVKLAQKIFFDITKSDMPKIMLNKLISEQNDVHNQNLFIKKFSLPILLAFLFALFNQLSGINAFLYYAPRIFESAGLESSSALLGTIGIGIANLIFTLLGLYLIDKAGRKLLMYIGSIGYIVSLTLVSLAFINSWEGLSVPLFLFIFIASHAIGQGAVIWVFISEIFPNKLRAKGQSLGSSVHWFLAAIITLVMPTALSYFNNPGYVFIFFAFMMLLQLFFVAFMMPETKGISLEDLSEKLSS